MQRNLDKLQTQLREAEKAELTGTGNAIVVFSYSVHKGNILDDHYRATKCAQNFLSPDLHRMFNIVTRALLLAPFHLESRSLAGICKRSKPSKLHCV